MPGSPQCSFGVGGALRRPILSILGFGSPPGVIITPLRVRGERSSRVCHELFSRYLWCMKHYRPMAHSNRNNILYVVLEDFSTLASPAFGAQYGLVRSALHTPNLDRLAAQGTTFQHAYCQSPICNPSRTSFLTSRRPSSTRCYTNDDLQFPPLPTLSDFLRASAPHAIIACGGGGKIFHIACDKEERGFINGAAQLRNDETMLKAADQRLLRGLNRSWSGAAGGGQGGVHSPGWGALTANLYGKPPTGRTNDQDKTRVAIRLLAHYARMRERFFLAVGLSATHVQGSSICMTSASHPLAVDCLMECSGHGRFVCTCPRNR